MARKQTARLAAFRAIIGWLAVGVNSMALAASAEPLDIDDGLRAKIQMQKGKINLMTNRADTTGGDGGDSGSGSSNCDINIGNTQSQSGVQGITGRDTTVIVTGPVINVGKCSNR